MKKLLISTFAITSMVLAPALKADVYNADTSSDAQTEELQMQPDETEQEEGTEVGQAASDGSNAAKKRQWQNIALAVGAVALAVTALILVANNNGHHKN